MSNSGSLTETLAEVEITGEPTALYRFYAADGTLLYVGVTGRIPDRFRRHQADKAWWPQVARKTMTWYGSRPEALAAEGGAIRSELPAWNIMRRKPPGVRKSSRVRKHERAGRPKIGGLVVVCLGGLLPEVDAYAQAHGVKRADAIRQLVSAGLAVSAS